jgi:predicted dithiol-disulfide oxidoreductase (DUF899 family)
MTQHTTGTREEWLAARVELLDAEKDLTRRGDELASRRRELPWAGRFRGRLRATVISTTTSTSR